MCIRDRVNASWAWAPDSLTSEWISLTPGNTLSGGNLYSEPAGTYVYETSFVLPKDFTSAQLSGIWSIDNLGSAVTLNGNPGSGVAPVSYTHLREAPIGECGCVGAAPSVRIRARNDCRRRG